MNVLNKYLRKNLYRIATVFVLTVSVIFAGVTLYALGARNSIDATSVGPIYLGNQNEKDFVGILEREISIWAGSAEYRFVFQDYEYSLQLSRFDFDAESTVQSLTRNTNNLAYFSLPAEELTSIQTELAGLFTPGIADYIDYDQLITTLLTDLGQLYQRKTYNIDEFLAVDLFSTVINSDTIDDIEPSDVATIIATVSRISIGPNDHFSLLEQLNGMALSNEQLSILASGIQSMTIGTAFSNFIFESYSDVPTWAESGKNVRVLLVNEYDFSFYNSFSQEYTIVISSIDATTLKFELVGYPFVSVFQIAFTEVEVIPFQTVIIDDPSINAATPGIAILETDTDYIYRLLVQSGILGSVIFCQRTETRTGNVSLIERLFIEQVIPIDQIYRENIVSKGGD